MALSSFNQITQTLDGQTNKRGVASQKTLFDGLHVHQIK